MTAPVDPRERLTDLVSKRRKELGLSLSGAAERAGIDRGTWTGIERGTRRTEVYNFATVERVLGWQPGSIEAVLAGGEPELIEPPAVPVAGGRRPRETVEQLIEEVWADPAMGLGEKETMVDMIVKAETERRAAEAKLKAIADRYRQAKQAG